MWMFNVQPLQSRAYDVPNPPIRETTVVRGAFRKVEGSIHGGSNKTKKNLKKVIIILKI